MHSKQNIVMESPPFRGGYWNGEFQCFELPSCDRVLGGFNMPTFEVDHPVTAWKNSSTGCSGCLAVRRRLEQGQEENNLPRSNPNDLKHTGDLKSFDQNMFRLPELNISNADQESPKNHCFIEPNNLKLRQTVQDAHTHTHNSQGLTASDTSFSVEP